MCIHTHTHIHTQSIYIIALDIPPKELNLVN